MATIRTRTKRTSSPHHAPGTSLIITNHLGPGPSCHSHGSRDLTVAPHSGGEHRRELPPAITAPTPHGYLPITNHHPTIVEPTMLGLPSCHLTWWQRLRAPYFGRLPLSMSLCRLLFIRRQELLGGQAIVRRADHGAKGLIDSLLRLAFQTK